MRSLLAWLPCSLIACGAPDDAAFTYRSTLQQSTRGLVLHEGGEDGHAGMFGTNCPFETRRGRVTGDADLPDEGEEVQDGGESALGPETVVAVIPGVVHLLEKSTGDYVIDSRPWDGVVGARLVGDGLVGLLQRLGGCAVGWRPEGGPALEVEVGDCDPRSFDASPAGEVVLGGDPVRIVTREGTVDAGTDGRLVAFDDALGLIYVARAGGSELTGLEPDGSLRWATPIAGAIRSLAAAGRPGAAVLSVERPDGSGAVLWVDGRDGAQVGEVVTPSAAPSVAASPDGRVVALVLPDETHFYEVDPSRLTPAP